MRLDFKIDKTDNIVPIIDIITKYGKDYIIIMYRVDRIDDWIHIGIELIRSSAVRLSEYRNRSYRPSEIIKLVQIEMDNLNILEELL